MDMCQRIIKSVRRVLGVLLVVVGLSTTWAWGEVARLAGPAPVAEQPPVAALYAAWQLDGGEQPSLFRSTDEGATWLPLALPGGAAPLVWAGDGGQRVAVATGDGSILRSDDLGNTWTGAAKGLPVSSLVWDDDGGLYLGTRGQGIYRLARRWYLAGHLDDARGTGLGTDCGSVPGRRPSLCRDAHRPLSH